MENSQSTTDKSEYINGLITILERDNIIPKGSNIVRVSKPYETHTQLRKGYRLLKQNYCTNKECSAYKLQKAPVGRFFSYIGEDKFKPAKRIHVCLYCNKCKTSYIFLPELRELIKYSDNDFSNIKCLSSKDYQEIKKDEDDNKSDQSQKDADTLLSVLKRQKFVPEDCNMQILNSRFKSYGAKNRGCQNKDCSKYRNNPDAICIGTYFVYKNKRPITDPFCYYCDACNTSFIFKPSIMDLRQYSDHNLNELFCITEEEYNNLCRKKDGKEDKDDISTKKNNEDKITQSKNSNTISSFYDLVGHKEKLPDSIDKDAIRKRIQEKKEEKKARIDELKRADIKYVTFLVRGDNNSCKKSSHNIISVKAKSGLLIDKEQVEVIFDACYCEDCCAYYIENTTYNKLKKAGRLLCPIISKRSFENRQSLDTSSLSVQSKLSLSGYNVDSRFDFDDNYRKELLKNIVDSGVASVDEIVKLISFCITTHSNQPGFEKAVEKWKRDLNEIREYNSNNIYNVKKIVTL